MEIVPALRRRALAYRSSGRGHRILSDDPTVTLAGCAPTTIVLSGHGEQHRTRRRDDGERVQYRCQRSQRGYVMLVQLSGVIAPFGRSRRAV